MIYSPLFVNNKFILLFHFIGVNIIYFSNLGLITRSNNPSPSSSSSGSVQSQGQQLAKPVTPNAVLTLLQEPLSESMVRIVVYSVIFLQEKM